MLRQPESRYEVGRSLTLLKVKSFHDAEARVLEHLKGAGRHKGRLGACSWSWPTARSSRSEPASPTPNARPPPPVGSVITFRFQELSDGGVPRFPSYVGVRRDAAWPDHAGSDHAPAAAKVPSTASDAGVASNTARRFELVEGSSSKFWEVARDGCAVTVRYGRIGTDGQAKTKEFASEELARRHADGLIEEKVAKGYRERG